MKGILLPVSSLNGNYGIGSFLDGIQFVDYLSQNNHSVWQMLPINPVSFDSPYSATSAFALNPYYLDIDSLFNEGLLRKSEIKEFSCETKNNRIDYALLRKNRIPLLELAYKRVKSKGVDYQFFCDSNAYWLEDYSLFAALKQHFDTPWNKWEAEIKNRNANRLPKLKEQFAPLMDFHKWVQFKCFNQFFELKNYANSKGIKLFGDVPMYVTYDSCDVWANRSLFLLNSRGGMTYVSAVPPDYFSKTGQLWGNPIYNYENMRKDDYLWWRNRLAHTATLFDMLRIDHFIAFSRYYCVKASNVTAKSGVWVEGEGEILVDVITETAKNIELIAEDLGLVDEKSNTLTEYAKCKCWLDMRVVQFGFDGNENNIHLPHMHDINSVCYIGTHDNMTLVEWLKSLGEGVKAVSDYFEIPYDLGIENLAQAIIGAVQIKSQAKYKVLQMQDVLGLGSSARMNFPGKDSGQWVWRIGS